MILAVLWLFLETVMIKFSMLYCLQQCVKYVAQVANACLVPNFDLKLSIVQLFGVGKTIFLLLMRRGKGKKIKERKEKRKGVLPLTPSPKGGDQRNTIGACKHYF